ncbi:MAG: hypothetical protein AVDCRST_MAG66-2416 [uncultured Pseudonocardia sp.]|uniref:Uncharacterized protein n=1 Tax=uncultured Pseudonocardia sp. TaxID=211455 RepID=A0A6J4PHF1_9PSEU|nr:MAG: hypothetical protein AVDCRST_MAG66-2416 [uncultured Pseudonocardia sp.]
MLHPAAGRAGGWSRTAPMTGAAPVVRSGGAAPAPVLDHGGGAVGAGHLGAGDVAGRELGLHVALGAEPPHGRRRVHALQRK